ncbi:hypothetical protein [Elizabethkingia sp. JS20170427COW]|uniref:hypothetical protein n=1 Tax=Elizabethkingia sp. JS20170427COW TaxID=2583851 RepID=UPI001110232A|nr:hypothetical protein [Elizabethkingia sp. JS20170427COW]QCX54231.1 hypothetical protein FGE20_11000 [Elizabethkingia sp. JS20170427COW]
MMKKTFLGIGFSLLGLLVNAQEAKGLNQQAPKTSSSQIDYNNYKLEGKTFATVRDSADHVEVISIQFHPDDKIDLVEKITDKKTKEEFVNHFTGDVVRRGNAVSVKASLLEGEKITYPVVYNLILTSYQGFVYMINIQNREKWVEEQYLDLTRKAKKKKRK